jgi:hypothetical protein
MSRKFALGAVVLLCVAVVCVVANKGTSQDTWQDTDFTTNMWSIISSGNVEELKNLLESNQELATVRSSDGRGPLWWAHEYQQPDMVQILLDAGALPNERDADGKKASEVNSVGPTEFMKTRQDTYDAYEEESPAKNYHGDELEDFE